MIITLNLSMLFSILIVGAVYVLFESLQNLFILEYEEASEDIHFSTNESTNIGRKLLTLDPNVNEDSLELKPDLDTFNKEKLNRSEIFKEVSKSFIPYNKLRRNRVKKLIRRKRDAHHNDFGWKLSLNVTNSQKHPKGASNLASKDDLLAMSKKGKLLNMAVQMEGASPDDSFKELHLSWDSLGLFLKSLYGKNASFKENAGDNTPEIISEPNDIIPSDILTEKSERGRAPKLIFGFFNTRSSEKPLEGIVTTHGNGDSSESATSPKLNVASEEGLISTKAPLSTTTIEAPMEVFGLTEPISVESTIVPITESFMDIESTSSEFNTLFVEKFEKTSASPDNDFPIKITTIKPDDSFTSEQLKEFCISLLSRIHVSPKSVGHFSEEDGSGELEMMSIGDKETMTESPPLSTEVPKEITTKSSNQRFGIWASIWNRFAGRRMVQHPLEVNLQSSTLTAEHDIVSEKANSIDNALSLKGETSTHLGVSDSTESDFFGDEDGSALTIPDCESFFRQMQNDAVFSKPNLLDIINNPILLSIDPSQFNFTEIRDEKQMRSMRSGSDSTDSNIDGNVLLTEKMVNSLNTPFSSAKSTAKDLFEISANDFFSEKPDKNLFEITVSKQDALSTPSFIDAQESIQNERFDKPNIDNLIAENEKDLATEIAFLSDKLTTMQIQSSTGILDNGLLIQFDVHGRTEKTSEMPSTEVSEDIDHRIFGILNFGSGERNLEMPSTSEMPSTEVNTDIDHRIFGMLNFGSGERSLERPSTSEMPSTEVNTDINQKIFGIMNFGSGERSLEDSDSLSTENVSEFPENRSFHPDLINFASGDSELNEAFSDGLEITSTNSATGLNIFDVILNLRKEESLMNSTESDAFDINEENQPTEGGSTILPVEKSRIEFQFDPEEKLTENPNILDLTNMTPTKSFSDDRQSIFNEKPRIESQLNHEEKFTESQNVVLDSTRLPVTQSLSKDSISFQNGLDVGSGDEGNRIFPGLMNVFGSGDGRELSEISTDPELNSEFSECLGCFKNKSTSFSIDECIDCESDVNYTVPLIGEKISTTINPLSHKIVSDATIDEIYLDNKVDTYSETNRDRLEFSTVHSPVTGPIIHEHHDNPENIGYDVYKYNDSSENIGYDVYKHNDSSENIGYDIYEHHDSSENIGYEITSFQPLEHVHVEAESNSDIETEAFSESPTEAIAVPKDHRFIDTLFLTGSGEGGLFGNDNGEINLVQEPDTTSFPFQHPPVTPRQSRRGGRRDDIPFGHTWTTEKKEHVSENQFDDIQPQNASDNPKLNSYEKSKDAKVLQTPGEVKEFNTDTISLLTTFRSIQSIEDGFNNPKFTEYTTQPLQDLSKETVTAISIPVSSFVIPKKKVKDLPPRYCNHAGECDVILNEGCITKEGRGVCDCRRSFVRDPETDICEAPFILKTSLKLPGEVFHQDLRDKYSELYRKKTRDAIDTMWLVVYQDQTLQDTIADVDVVGFEEGSLVIHWELIFAVKTNESISEIVQEVDERLKETFKRRVVLQSAPLNVENAKLLSVSSDNNPCENKELNYCSKHAECLKDEYRGFKCRCKEGYLDNSKHPMYRGEICIATCLPDYCGENGFCEVRWNGEKQCLCNGWYFGEKCNVSGTLVISCFAGANAVLIIVVLAIIFFCRRRRQRGTRFYENNQIRFQPNPELGPFGRVSPRLAATIALDELGPTKTSKYKAISTPLYMVPDIHITSPSILGSSISYDYDSTFDRTPSAEVNMEPPKYDSVPEVPKYDSVPEV